jgi:hypothetical protein
MTEAIMWDFTNKPEVEVIDPERVFVQVTFSFEKLSLIWELHQLGLIMAEFDNFIESVGPRVLFGRDLFLEFNESVERIVTAKGTTVATNTNSEITWTDV